MEEEGVGAKQSKKRREAPVWVTHTCPRPRKEKEQSILLYPLPSPPRTPTGEGSHGGMFVLNFVVVSSIASLAPPA